MTEFGGAGRLFKLLFPGTFDNSYQGKKLALWMLGGIVLIRFAMYSNSILNSRKVLVSADGIPLGNYPAAAADTIVSLFSLLGFSSLVLCLLALLSLIRYRSMVPLMFALMILQYAGGRIIFLFHPMVRTGQPIGTYFNLVLLVGNSVGLVLSLSAQNLARAQQDYELAKRAARMWPNREHESNAFCQLLCRLGLHRWRRMNLAEIMPGHEILHCFWCSKVKVDGIIYDT
jgi:hypothetical protein